MKKQCDGTKANGTRVFLLLALTAMLVLGGGLTARAGTVADPCTNPSCRDTAKGWTYTLTGNPELYLLMHDKQCNACGMTDRVFCSLQVISTIATCTQAGDTTIHCLYCGANRIEYGEPLGHTYKTTVTAPTCTAQGYTTHTCSRGDSAVTDAYVPALGHAYQTTVTAPTCTTAGNTVYKCARCGATHTAQRPALGHALQYDAGRSRPAACDQTGLDAYTCTRCGAQVDTVLSALPHWYGAWTPAGDDAHSALCRRCGENKTAPCAMTTLTLDAVELSACTVCGRGSQGEPLIGATCLPLRLGDMPANADLAVYHVALPEGVEGALYAIGLEVAGAPVTMKGPARITLPEYGEGAYEVYLLGADGARTPIPAPMDEGKLVFDIAQPGLYLLLAAK